MGVDFHWIGTTISSGSSHNGFGKIVSFPSVPASFPPYGTLLETLVGQEYPIANGGAVVTVNSIDYPSQNATVDRLADGSGGSFLDWANLRDVAYKPYETLIYTDSNAGTANVYVSELGTDYEAYSYTGSEYRHDGSGSFYSAYIGITYKPSGYYYGGDGTPFTTGTSVEVPVASGNWFYNQTADETAAIANGSGGYNWTGYNVQFYPYGTYITNDGTNSYYWDGTGGFYS